MARRYTALIAGATPAGDVEVVTHGPTDVYDVYQVGPPGVLLGPLVGYVTKNTSAPTSREWEAYDHRRVRIDSVSTMSGALYALARHRQAVLGLSRV